jgi:pimeloyl-ACP methyl ester carboxylesterase
MEPERFAVESGGLRLAGLAWGDPAAPPLVLVHGIRDHALSFDPIARALAADFRVLAPDLRGHGESPRTGSYAMAEFVADVDALVAGLGLERPVLVGHSLGGQIVLRYAGLFDEVPAAVVSIEGLGPPRRAAEAAAEARRARLRERVRSLREAPEPREPLPDFAAALARFRQRNPRLSEARARALVERGTEPAPAGGVRFRFDPEVSKVWTTLSPDENEEVWSWVRCPVLVVTAADSARYWRGRGLSEVEGAEFDADHARKLALFADLEHVLVPDAGHMIHYDQPDVLARALTDFLKRRLG